MCLRLVVIAALIIAGGACARTPILPPPEPTFGIAEQQETLLRWLEGDFEATTSDGQEILWRIRNIPGFRAMVYMERFFDGAEAPDRQELWYVEPPADEIRIQSWRHVRPHLFAGATGNPDRLGNEYIYDMRRNEEINYTSMWANGQFHVSTVFPAPQTGPAGHPDSRPVLTMSILANQIMRIEQFSEGQDRGTSLVFQRVP